MKIVTRFLAGYAVLLAMLAAALIYQAIAVHRIQATNEQLTRINFRAALDSVDLMRRLDLVEEYSRKYFAIRDPGYLTRLRAFGRDFESGAAAIANHARSAQEKAEILRVGSAWSRCRDTLEAAQASLGDDAAAPFPAELEEELNRLYETVSQLHRATLRAIEAEVSESNRTAQSARLISWTIAGTALALSLLVSVGILRSVSISVKQLTEGTRAIAEGDFSCRLDASRNDEFSQLAGNFNVMAHRLNELDQLKKDFVSHVSHEIKSPLASMRETIQLLLEGIPGSLTDKQKRLLELNLKSSHRLNSMIGNLLDMSRMEAGVLEYQFKRQDLAPLLQTAIAEFQVQADEKKVEIRCALPEAPLVVECDGDRLIQVFANLIGNAVKFSPAQSAIEIEAARADHAVTGMPPGFGADGCAIVSIRDSGPGVPDEDKTRIFEKFHQVRRGGKLPGEGVGLGLAICRTIVTAHGGALWVEDNTQGGSIFRLVLRSGDSGDAASPESTLKA